MIGGTNIAVNSLGIAVNYSEAKHCKMPVCAGEKMVKEKLLDEQYFDTAENDGNQYQAG